MVTELQGYQGASPSRHLSTSHTFPPASSPSCIAFLLKQLHHSLPSVSNITKPLLSAPLLATDPWAL